MAAAGRAGSERNRLRVAVTTAGERILPLALRSFRTQFPEAEIGIEVGNRERVWDLLVHREVDLVLGRAAPGGPRPGVAGHPPPPADRRRRPARGRRAPALAGGEQA